MEEIESPHKTVVIVSKVLCSDIILVATLSLGIVTLPLGQMFVLTETWLSLTNG